MWRPAPLPTSRWTDDPILFAREALGIEPWARQQDILRAVAAKPRVAVKSGHRVSKSNSAAILALWFWTTRPSGRVIMSSASARQVRETLWRELTKCYRAARVRLGGTLYATPSGGLRGEEGAEVLGLTTDAPERFAGFSGAEMLFILDEASGIDPLIFEAIEGNRAGGARIVLFSNPTQTSGEFFDAFHTKRHLYETITISSEESPNVTAGCLVIPGLATRDWIEEKKLEWGEDSPLYAVRIRGEFPWQSSNAVIGLGLVDRALARHHARGPERPAGDLQVGVDPAREGDDESVVVVRRGTCVLSIDAFHGLDGPTLAGKTLEIVRHHRAAPAEVATVKIDSIGIGASPYDALRKFPKELKVIPINVGESATSGDYVRLRDQVWFAARDWLLDGGSLPPDALLEGELIAPTYELDPRGRMKVESKKDIKKRLKRSPDRADALCLAIYSRAVPRVSVRDEYDDMLPRMRS